MVLPFWQIVFFFNLFISLLDSPKFRNKSGTAQQQQQRAAARSSMYETSRKVTAPAASKRPISAHNIVVVRAAAKEVGIEKDPELQRIQVWLQQIFFSFQDLF